MGLVSALVFVLFYSCQHALCYSGDPVMYLPPFEVRPMSNGRQPDRYMPNQQFQTSRREMSSPMLQQPILHTTPGPASPSSSMRLEKEKLDNRNFTLSDIYNALTLEDDRDERREGPIRNQELPRSAYDYPVPPYGYQRPSYNQYSYQEPVHTPPPAHHTGSKISLLKPDLGDLIKPVTTKVAGKVSGLIGLVLALLTGSSPNDLELKGFKDIVINGIVKPLLLAKGGIKTLISKLTIPVISLLLINLEVLVTIWWLWEDCSEHSAPHAHPEYSYPKPSYGYNSYR